MPTRYKLWIVCKKLLSALWARNGLNLLTINPDKWCMNIFLIYDFDAKVTSKYITKNILDSPSKLSLFSLFYFWRWFFKRLYTLCLAGKFMKYFTWISILKCQLWKGQSLCDDIFMLAFDDNFHKILRWSLSFQKINFERECDRFRL